MATEKIRTFGHGGHQNHEKQRRSDGHDLAGLALPVFALSAIIILAILHIRSSLTDTIPSQPALLQEGPVRRTGTLVQNACPMLKCNSPGDSPERRWIFWP